MSNLFQKIFSIFFLCCTSSACAAQNHSEISIIQLILTPEKYLEAPIKVKGYFKFGATSMIYQNHLSAEISEDASAIVVLDETSDGSLTLSCNKKYVAIYGVFSNFRNRFVISDVERVSDLKSAQACWEKTEKN